MTTQPTPLAVFEDSAGQLYLIPPALLDTLRVPADLAPALRAQMTAAEAHGFLLPATPAGLQQIGLVSPASASRLGNFEIQRLMSSFNQAETLSSGAQKQANDANRGVISTIG